MSSETNELALAADFPQASYDDWRKLVDGVLKGAPFEKLVSTTSDGLKIKPIYPRLGTVPPVVGRAAAAPWQILQRIDHPDPANANTQALHDLENGATGLEVEFAGGPGARGFGLNDANPETLHRLFEGIVLDAGIAISVNPVFGRENAGKNLADFIEARRIDPKRINLRFNYQPLSTIAVRGATPKAWSELALPVARMVSDLMRRGFKGPFFLADGRPVHDAGGSEAQELAFTLAVAVAYFRALEAAGIDLDLARGALCFRLAADADQFLTIAKFRALRLLWARIEQACGLAPKPIFVTAETAWRMLTRRDAYVNMLRATMAVFSAGLAGANAIVVLPHTLALGLPDAFARRLARNTQLILLEESNLAKVADPTAGAGGIEALTQQLCGAAWSLFQEIEKAGGAFPALQQGLIQSKVATTRKAREARIATRKDVLTGASEFPNLHEAAAAAVENVGAVELAPDSTAQIQYEPLSAIRLGVPFEALRDRSDEILKARGRRPQVFLANLGKRSDFTARATFARSFFEAGGIAAIDSEGFSDCKALAAACQASAAEFVCLCSSDKVYAELAADAARELQIAGSKHIYLAGRPSELEGSLRTAGVAQFIFAGADALAVLRDAYRRME
jgi:methylmalonyl-CoA mutase